MLNIFLKETITLMMSARLVPILYLAAILGGSLRWTWMDGSIRLMHCTTAPTTMSESIWSISCFKSLAHADNNPKFQILIIMSSRSQKVKLRPILPVNEKKIKYIMYNVSNYMIGLVKCLANKLSKLSFVK